MKLIIDINDNDYELINKTGVTLDLHTVFHGKDKDKEMTLDEAIKHCKEKAEELRKQIDTHIVVDAEEIGDCIECANEHEQLAEWLEELQEWRKLKAVCAFDGYVVYKSRTEVSDISEIEAYCDTCKHNEGYPTSEVCQSCGAFHHYEKGGAE